MFSGTPTASDILSNTLAATGTLITVPAGRWYTGNVCLSASVSVAGPSSPSISVSGSGSIPASGTALCRLNLEGLALSTVSDTIETEVLVKAPPSNSITIDFTAGANGTSSASINGYLYG